MAKKQKSPLQRVRESLSILEVDRSFIIFSAIYVPVAFLFLNRGVFAELLLAVYTLLMIIGGLYMIVRFLLELARVADDKKGNQMGSLFIMYLINVFVPLGMFKLLFQVSWWLTPTAHDGFLCQVRYFVQDLYTLFQLQNTLNFLLVGSLVAMFVFTLWAAKK